MLRPQPLRRFRKAQAGLAAVEFALILPLMLILFFGVVEFSLAFAARADVANISSAVADLIAQETTATNTDVINVFAAANAVLYPYPTDGQNGPSIRITSIIDDGAGNGTDPHSSGKVAWTCTQTGSQALATAPATNATVTFDQPLMMPNDSVIKVEVLYAYKSPTTYTLTGPVVMTNVFYTKPRRAPQIGAPTGNCNVTL